ncbi:AraC family transcriptional regulator [Streptomyces sp. NPDC060223]|uniref:AraC family transcriptional regulator n=1 Tax=Streptomyces sp. NPDC060223 TaxID=3347077 RepID=UPI0036506F33
MDEAQAILGSRFHDFRMEVLGKAEDFTMDVAVVGLGQVTIGRVSLNTPIKARLGELGAYNVSVPVSGSYGVRQGRGPTFYAGLGRAMVSDPAGDAVLGEYSDSGSSLTVRFETVALVRQLETLLGRPVHRRPVFAPVIDAGSGLGRSWVNLLSWCLLDRSVPHGLLQQPMFVGRIEQTLMEGLLLAGDHQYREALEAPPPNMRPVAVKRVMDAVRERPAEPYDAARLAAIGQVSVRTLQEAFRRNLGMSPMTYVHEVRLQRVREHLKVSAPGTVTVTEVAYRWGFAHLGRFAQRYRARFGETPSQTLQSA